MDERDRGGVARAVENDFRRVWRPRGHTNSRISLLRRMPVATRSNRESRRVRGQQPVPYTTRRPSKKSHRKEKKNKQRGAPKTDGLVTVYKRCGQFTNEHDHIAKEIKDSADVQDPKVFILTGRVNGSARTVVATFDNRYVWPSTLKMLWKGDTGGTPHVLLYPMFEYKLPNNGDCAPPLNPGTYLVKPLPPGEDIRYGDNVHRLGPF